MTLANLWESKAILDMWLKRGTRERNQAINTVDWKEEFGAEERAVLEGVTLFLASALFVYLKQTKTITPNIPNHGSDIQVFTVTKPNSINCSSF